MQRIFRLAVLPVLLLGCGETPAPTAVAGPSSAPLRSGAPTITTAPFFAVAECASDIGYDIRFGGQRALMVHTTTDASGKSHTLMQFRVQDFMGWRMPEPSPPNSAADFSVQGGAEMFAIQTDAEGRITVRIHQGNLVFQSLADGARVAAHHTIRQVPGRDPVSFWRCRLVG